MYVNVVVMSPNEGYGDELKASMDRYSEAARPHAGFKYANTLQGAHGDLFGIAVWDSEDSANAARPHLQDAVSGDDFGTWAADMRTFPFTVD